MIDVFYKKKIEKLTFTNFIDMDNSNKSKHPNALNWKPSRLTKLESFHLELTKLCIIKNNQVLDFDPPKLPIYWSSLFNNLNFHKLYNKNICIDETIHKYDYVKMKEHMKNTGIAEELMAYIFHPRNMDKWNDWGFSEHDDFIKFVGN